MSLGASFTPTLPDTILQGDKFWKDMCHEPLLKMGETRLDPYDTHFDKYKLWPATTALPLCVQLDDRQRTYHLTFHGKLTGLGSLKMHSTGQSSKRPYSLVVRFSSNPLPMPSNGYVQSPALGILPRQLGDLLKEKTNKSHRVCSSPDTEQVILAGMESFRLGSQHRVESLACEVQIDHGWIEWKSFFL